MIIVSHMDVTLDPRTGWALRRVYTGLLWLATLWVVANCVYVYLFLHGDRAFRIESAVFILAFLMLPRLLAGRHETGNRARPLTGHWVEHRLALVFVIGLWVVTLLPLLGFPFLSDDYVFLSLYRHITDAGKSPEFFRPVFAVVFLGLAKIGAGSPTPFHAASMVLHLSSAFLVFSLSRRLFAAASPAIVCFALFLLNPLQLEATLWVSGLQEVLWTFFLLSALRCYVGSKTMSVWRLLGTAVLIVAALLSKETAVCFVLLLPAADWIYFRIDRGPLIPAAYVGSLCLLIAYAVLRSQFVPSDPGFLVTPTKFFVKQFVATPYKYFVQPWNASAVHVPDAVRCAVSILMTVLLFMAVVVRGASARLLSGPFLILASTLPVYSYFFVGADLISSRYVYFASIGWALFMSQLIARVTSRRWVLAATFAALSVAATASLHLNLRPWRIAGDLVDFIETELRHGRSLNAIVADWERRKGITLVTKDHIPCEYHGVRIFINGYQEFLRHTRGE